MIGIHNDTFGLRTTTAVGSRTLSTNTYDSNHNLSQRTYGNGNTVSYTYDNFGNASTVSYNNVVAVKNLSDASGNIVRTQDLRTNLEHLADYDSTGRLISKDVLDLSVSGTADKWLRSIEYDFDENNNLTKLAFASKSGSNVTTHSYKNEDNECKDNLPTVTTLQNGRKVTYTHDAYGRLTSKNLDTSNALVYNYEYMDSLRDGDYTTTKIKTESIGENKYRYTYDAYGNITNIFSVSGNTETILYTYYYDVYNQLTTAIDHENSEKTEYTYNQAGNLTRRKRYTIDYSLNPTATLENISYVYGDSTWKDLLTSYNGQTITYDAIGNPLNYRDGITLTWQNGRELASYSDANYDITYSYGADGMRTKKSIDVLGDVKYVYEGGLLLQMDYLGKIFDFSYDANGTPIGFRYNDNGAISYYYYGVNSRGDIVSIYNVAGGEVVQYTYDAYGKPLTTSATSAYTSIADINPLRYRGYVYDRETGLYYLQSRYYDPETCRFINADVYCSTGQGITGNNMFAYCNNNPVIYYDHSGNRCCAAVTVKDEDRLDRRVSCQFQEYVSKERLGLVVDITKDLNDFMEENVRKLCDYKQQHGLINACLYFYHNVKDEGDLDIKLQDDWEFKEDKTYIYYGYELRYDDPGNINFGYVGSVLFPQTLLCLGAGGNQIKKYGFKYGDIFSFFDDPRDNRMVKCGVYLYWRNH